MTLFLDTSVVLAACESANGASRAIFELASVNGWILVATPYVVAEVARNVPDLSPSASVEWARLRLELLLMNDVLTLDRPAVFFRTKDRPILFGALAWAEVLLTLDQADFGELLGGAFYGLPVRRPGTFLAAERAAGRLRP